MGEPDPWGSIINTIWAAHLVDVEEAWDHATESNADLTPGESPLFPQLCFTGSTHASIRPVPTMVDPSPWEHAPDRVGSLVSVLASPPPAEPPEHVLARLQPEAPLGDALVASQQVV